MKLTNRQTLLIASAFSAVLAVATFLWARQTTFPWCDELVLVDKSANWALKGTYLGYVWPQTYNLLYPLSLSITFKLLGVSHASVCAFTILSAFLCSLVVLAAGRRRGLFAELGASLLFVSLFWCAGSLSWIYTNGRLESLTMLFSVLFADALLPDATRSPRKALALSALWGFALMLTSVYMLPLFFVLGLCALVVCRADERRGLLCRGFACAAAFALAYVLMMVFYVWTHETIRFAGFYLYFNTITGQAVGTVGERIVRAYGFDFWALVLSVLSFAFALTLRHARTIAFSLFVPAVPFLMTVLGRYEAYYSWAFCLPAGLLVVTCVRRWLREGVLFVLAGCVLAYGVSMRVRSYGKTEKFRMARDRAEVFVSEHPKLFASNEDVVVAEDVYGDTSFFYPLLNTGCRLWFRGTETLSGPSDREKFRLGLSYIVKDPNRREEVFEKAMAYQRCMPTLPASAVFVFPSAKSHENVVPMLRERGYVKVGDLSESGEIKCERWMRPEGGLE